MPELRRNPLDGRWVIVNPERAARPDMFRSDEPTPNGRSVPGPGPVAGCPFCPGAESQTPPEVARSGEGQPDGPGWRIRVVPNLYPIVAGEPYRAGSGHARFHDAARATGAHEVVVMSADHRRSLADLTGVELEELFDVVGDRVRAHLEAGHQYVQVLANHGRSAGASIDHPHLQLVAVDVPPPVVVGEAERIGRSRECPVCRAVAEDADPTAPLGIATHGPAPLWCPWWSAVPFEVMVAPREHRPRFEHSGPDTGDVARATGQAVALLREALGDVDYNLVLHTAPTPEPVDYHWHVHVWPRTSIQAGFEHGTGILVNSVPPEQAASVLRAAGASQ